MKSSRKRLAMIIGIAALAGLGWLLWPGREQPESSGRMARIARSSSRPGGEPIPGPVRTGGPRGEPEKPVAETPATWHFKNFFLPAMALHGGKTDDAIPLAEAVEKVRAKYVATAGRTKEAIFPLSVDLSKADGRMVRFQSPRAPVVSVLRLLAAVSGNRLAGSGPDFAMVALPADDGRTDHSLELTGTDLKKLEPFFKDPVEGPWEPDPFSPEERHLDAIELLSAPLGPDPVIRTSADDPPTTSLEHATASDLAIVSALAELADSPALQGHVIIKNRDIQLPEGRQWPEDYPGTMTTGGDEALMRELAGMQGAELLSAPSIVTPYGWSATVETSSIDGAGHGGRRILFASLPLGTASEDSVTVTEHGSADIDPQWGTSAVISSGSTAMMVSKTEGGRTILHLHTSQRVDASGRPVVAPAE